MEKDNSDSIKFESKIPSIEEEYLTKEKCIQDKKHCLPNGTFKDIGRTFCSSCSFECP